VSLAPLKFVLCHKAERLKSFVFYISTPARKNIVSHFCKFVRRRFIKNAININELMQSKFGNLGYHRLVYAVVNLHNYKHSSSFGIFRKKERKYIYLTAHLSKYIKKRNDYTKEKRK
jgi:hypothetical protein